MSIRVTGGTGGAAWLSRQTGVTAIRSGGGISIRVYGASMSASVRTIEGDRWRSNETADLLLELYRDVGLRWESITIYTDDDRAHTLPASPDDAPEGWRPAFTTEKPMTPCLDRGFVRLLAHMGSDATVCAAARISYGADPASPVEDERLIRYLMRNGHTSPFEMAEIQVHVKAPIFVARQWMRHRTASINEVSARYKVLPEEVYIPDQIHGAPTNSKQGRGAVHPDSARWRRGMEAEAASALRRYREMIAAGVAPEQARIVLPVGVYTEWVWKIDLHNLLHFLALRLHPHAQQEIRVYASALALVVAELFPLTWSAFLDYRVNAVTLSAPEIRTLRAVLEGVTVPPVPGHGRGEAGEWAALWSDDAP